MVWGLGAGVHARATSPLPAGAFRSKFIDFPGLVGCPKTLRGVTDWERLSDGLIALVRLMLDDPTILELIRKLRFIRLTMCFPWTNHQIL
jgi:hypothetical protein